jgi:hypothetical protein
MFAAGASGEVLAQFVFDAHRHVDTSSVRIIGFSQREFITGVRRAIGRWTGVPALVDGKARAQWLTVDFEFRPSCAGVVNPPVIGNSALLCVAPPDKR